MNKQGIISRNIIISSVVCLAFLLNTGCNNRTVKEEKKESQKSLKAALMHFNADSAYLFVKKQVDFGPRVPESKAHQLCGDYIVTNLRKYHAVVTEQKSTVTAYDGSELPLRNIIASFGMGQSNRIFLAAHWDCRPWADHSKNPANWKKPIDGANDGASGVGILLEIARLIGEQKLNTGVDLVFFDVEDYGTPEFRKDIRNDDSWCLGAQYWAANLHGYNAKYGVLLDMTGGKNATFCQEEFSKSYAPDVVNKIWTIASNAGYSGYFPFETGGKIIDDHLYINRIAGIPTIDIIQYDPGTDSGFNAVWHTENDNMSNIDKNTLMAVGQTLLTVIANE